MPAPYIHLIHGDWVGLEKILQDLSGILNVDTTFSEILTPPGSDGEVIYNNDGAYGADPTFSFNDTTKAVTAQQLIQSKSSSSVPFIVKSTDGSNQINIYHNNTNSYIEWNDGRLVIQSIEGTNNDTWVRFLGRGTGRALYQVSTSDLKNTILVEASHNRTHIRATGADTPALELQSTADKPIKIFTDAAEGETPLWQHFGWGTGSGGRESLDISVEKYAANTADFIGLENYLFGGNLITKNFTHDDSDGGGSTLWTTKRERSGGEEADIFSITGSHDGAGDDELAKVAIGVNMGAGLVDALEIDSVGALQFPSAGGMVFGSMYVAAEFTVTIGDANPTEVAVTITGDGWTAGDLKKVTFPTGGTEHYLTVPVPGIYEVIWSMSVHKDAGPATSIHGGIMKNGVAQTGSGEAHADFGATDVSDCIGSPGTVDCPNGTEQISLWTSNDQSNDVHVDHGTMLIRQIRGT